MTQNTTTGGDHLTRGTAKRETSRGRRAGSAALGGTLLIAGLRRRSLGGAVMALAGGWLLYRGVRGRRRQSESESEPKVEPESESKVEPESEPKVESEAEPESGDADASAEYRETDAGTPSEPMAVERSATVDGSPVDLYRYWRDPEQLNRILGEFAEVSSAGDQRHHWSVPTPLGRSIEWETEILEDRPGEVLRWQSTESAVMSSEGSVQFREAPADRGTEVTLALRFDPPGGQFGRTVMELLAVAPQTLANEMLHRFKSLAETGEIPTLERNPSGRGSGDMV